MIGYKIRYGDYDHDCWGKTEFCGWYDYEDVVYTNLDECKKVKAQYESQYGNRDWDIYEIEIK